MSDCYALALVMMLALTYGFTGVYPNFTSRPIQGTAFVCIGLVSIYIPMQFLVAAVLVAHGTRLVWVAACEKQTVVTDFEIDRAKSHELLPYNHREVERVHRD